jgi:hypothetical protein
VVAKVEAHDKGSNRRFVVSNRPGAELLPGPTYDEYVERGESENRNKEIKCGLEMDRLSDHRFCANYFRLYLHALAMNLLVRLRRQVAEPWPAAAIAEPAGPVAAPTGDEAAAGHALPVPGAAAVPAEATTGRRGVVSSGSVGSGIRWAKVSRAPGVCC